ncbi:putative glycerol-3-phosphate acyltransferase [Ferriphaselus amnicola]|jgi:glycerol-3-phosphate acyltransferase PlsY|uniref:Glycerol-3-phosphate acyltransferase n=1 Tax=Ferriphaselus amnicola TaxID=1188319 RepID=A0A2Z6GFB5_9PROT|nr:glycerol-3-phosphate 1-O-acyltransferase PlsY [Ferriphaselus amnicola]BBE52190.1 putative glycerol-3-phosphate acyltransferase [Ferriphaselus amnicola]
MPNLFFVVSAYLIGSISFAVITSKAFGLPDPRSYGSGNPGATNVLRTGKKAAAALTLLGDAAKGWLAVFLTLKFAPQDAQLVGLVASVSIAVFLGHLFPIFFKFQGGKGVATALGILLALNPWLGLAAFGTWLIVAKVFKVSSLAALIAAASAPIFTWLLNEPMEYTAVAFTLAVLLVWRHKSNIQKLLSGQEGKIGGKA